MTEYFDADGDPIVFPEGMSDEAKELIAGQYQRVGMIRADVENRISDFFQSLTLEQVQTFRIITGQIARQGGLASYYEGIAVGVLHMKFDVSNFTVDPNLLGKSSVPGTDHVPAAGGPAEGKAIEPPFDQEHDSTHPPIHPGALAAAEEDSPTVLPSSEDEADNYILYNVLPAEGGEAVVCRSCGLVYVSLADRMVKGPDDCHGCQQKAAWG